MYSFFFFVFYACRVSWKVSWRHNRTNISSPKWLLSLTGIPIIPPRKRRVFISGWTTLGRVLQRLLVLGRRSPKGTTDSLLHLDRSNVLHNLRLLLFSISINSLGLSWRIRIVFNWLGRERRQSSCSCSQNDEQWREKSWIIIASASCNLTCNRTADDLF